MKSMHIHDVYEIFMPMSDHVKFFVHNRVYSLERGDVILFTNTDLHKVSIPDQAEYNRWVITFSADQLGRKMADSKYLVQCFEDSEHRHLKLTPDEQLLFRTLAETMERESQNQQPNEKLSDISQWLCLGQLLLLLCRISRRLPQGLPQGELSQSPYIHRVLQYVDENFRENISLDTISTSCFLNKSYLCRLFKRETGFHIHDYIIYRRLSNAMALLRGGKSVHDAAEESGFSSDTFFITVFRRQIGTTPYQYAKRHRVQE